MERVGRSLVERVGRVAVVVLIAASMAAAPARSDPPAEAAGGTALDGETATVALVAGYEHTCALSADGKVRCWGWNSNGQLGSGDTHDRGDGPAEMGGHLPVVDLGAGRTATAIAAGTYHSCALLDNGAVKCWGANSRGQLGLGDSFSRGDEPGEMGDSLPAVSLGTGRTATAVAAGRQHTCARLENGAVKCWGYNLYGQLGLGDSFNRGDEPGEMGDSLPAVSLGTGRTATKVATGGDHSCARLDDATVKCWGANFYGQLGLGDPVDRGDEPGEMGDSLPAVSLGTGRTATAVTVGALHTCARLDNGSVKCWGDNRLYAGQLGLGDTEDRGDGPGEMGDSLPAVSLGTGRTSAAISAGDYHTCAILDDLSLRCWGYNSFGTLGLGDNRARGDEGGEMGDSLPAVDLGTGRSPGVVTGGYAHTCARLDDGTVKCWGSGSHGELGSGDTANRGDQPGEMGDSLPVVLLQPTGVSGTVSETGSGSPVDGAWVAVLRTTDFSIAAGAIADPNGDYSTQVAPGAYYLYVIDPAGAHTAGFHGPPTLVTVTANHTVDADPTMAATRGAINGTVTEDHTRTPGTAVAGIAGAWALALSTNTANTGSPETVVIADTAGRFTIPALTPRTHYVGYIDPTGDHATRFYTRSPNVPEATPVTVTAANTTRADGALPPQQRTPPGALITGTVTETGTDTPLPDVHVMALHAADYRIARGAVTDTHGEYTLDVEAGDYKLAYIDSTGRHTMEWNDNRAYHDLDHADTVTAPAETKADLDPNTGTMAGTIVDDPAATAVPGAWVIAIAPNGIAAGAITAANGTYTLPGLTPGTYRATFVDPNGGRTQEYWDNSPTYPGATPINITAATTTTINAALHHP